MSFDDELNFGLIDDPTPPDPDATRLGKVVARGRQRLIRRRVIFGGIAGSVALVLVGSGVAVAQHNDASPQVQVQPTTTTIAKAATAVREADMNGLHYTLTLVTPVVSAGGRVTVAQRIDNRTNRSMSISTCSFKTVVVVDSPHLSIVDGVCPGAQGTPIVPGGSGGEGSSSTIAPETPGLYRVVVEPTAFDELPEAFLQMEPFHLRVLPSGGPTPGTTSTTAGSSSEPLGPSPTEVAGPGVTLPRDPQDASPGMNDFVGTLTARKSTTTVGHAVQVSLTVRNNTDHTLEPTRGSLPNALGIVCANDLTPDGHTNHELRSEKNLFFVNVPPLATGESGARSASFVPTADDIGTVTCEAVLLNTTKQWQPGTVTSSLSLTTIPAVRFAVSAPNESTTASPSSAVRP